MAVYVWRALATWVGHADNDGFRYNGAYTFAANFVTCASGGFEPFPEKASVVKRQGYGFHASAMASRRTADR